ncbi:MAG: T9SS type A sorting domain-containing protein, partial [Gemmatimonadetes bacterium]|nr:T9SS type A sorting domain-containing protein [Gemmatimonadota bacterium]
TQYYDKFTDDLRQEIFDAALGDPEMWKIEDVLEGGGAYLSGSKAMHYLELHDEAWPSSGGQRIVKTIDGSLPHDDMWAKGRVKLGQGVVMFAAGVPAILQGSEWLEDTDFGTGLGNRIDWGKKITYAPIYQYMKDIIGERRTNSAFRANAGIDVYKVDEANNVIVWQRFDGSGNVAVVVANFSNANRLNYRVGMPSAGTWYELINSQASVYDGNGLGNGGQVSTEGIAWDGQSQSAVLTVPQMGLLVFSKTAPVPTDVPTGPAPQLEKMRFESVRPNPTRAEAIAVFHLPAATEVRMDVFDIRGRLVTRVANETFPAGRQRVVWDGRAGSGERAPAGIYFMKLESGGSTVTKKLILLK